MASLTLEEALRQHRKAQQRRPKEQDAALRRIKAEHLKSRGDEAIKQGNYREAWERYEEAIELEPDPALLPVLHSNCSLAYSKVGRHGEALAEAGEAARLAPKWHKAHWRRATALLALKKVPEAVQACREAWRLASAAAASPFSKQPLGVGASTTAGDVAECEARLWSAVQRLTREQVAAGMLGVLGDMQAAGQLEAPAQEEAMEKELQESLFFVIKMAHKGRPRPGVFYRRYLRWLRQGVQPGEAYTVRAAAHTGAKCFLQGRADAQAAVEALQAALRDEREREQRPGPGGNGGSSSGNGSGGGTPVAAPQSAAPASQHASFSHDGPAAEDGSTPGGLRHQLALAYQQLGEACNAEPKHADRDCRTAAKAFLRALEMDGEVEGVKEALQEVGKDLTLEQMNQVESEVYHEGPADGSISSSLSGPATPSGFGPTGARLAPGQKLFRVALQLAFPSAKASDCSSRARELLREGVAAAAGVDPLSVTIERVAAPTAARPFLGLSLHVRIGGDVQAAGRLAQAVGGGAAGSGGGSEQQEGSQVQQQQECDFQPAAGQAAGQGEQPDQQQRLQRLVSVLGGEAITSLLGQPDPGRCGAEVEDVTPGCAGASEAEQAEQDAINRGEKTVPAAKERRLVVPQRPKTELEVPYRMYRLVRADGTAVERVDKHPFCMSRVYYDATEKPEEVWTELADGSVRWRQTGGEVKLLALKVPPELPSKQLAVDIQPYSLKVFNRASGEVYLEGQLERGVVPEDSFWTHCGGEGEDSCAIYLRKMNLELLQKHWMHNEMWWPRLFRAHGEIVWDDYEKDYSDLPEEVLQKHRVQEAIQGKERKVEKLERESREALQERNDLRKRTRQERLNELRTGRKLSWVELNRGLPAPPPS